MLIGSNRRSPKGISIHQAIGNVRTMASSSLAFRCLAGSAVISRWTFMWMVHCRVMPSMYLDVPSLATNIWLSVLLANFQAITTAGVIYPNAIKRLNFGQQYFVFFQQARPSMQCVHPCASFMTLPGPVETIPPSEGWSSCSICLSDVFRPCLSSLPQDCASGLVFVRLWEFDPQNFHGSVSHHELLKPCRTSKRRTTCEHRPFFAKFLMWQEEHILAI